MINSGDKAWSMKKKTTTKDVAGEKKGEGDGREGTKHVNNNDDEVEEEPLEEGEIREDIGRTRQIQSNVARFLEKRQRSRRGLRMGSGLRRVQNLGDSSPMSAADDSAALTVGQPAEESTGAAYGRQWRNSPSVGYNAHRPVESSVGLRQTEEAEPLQSASSYHDWAMKIPDADLDLDLDMNMGGEDNMTPLRGTTSTTLPPISALLNDQPGESRITGFGMNFEDDEEWMRDWDYTLPPLRMSGGLGVASDRGVEAGDSIEGPRQQNVDLPLPEYRPSAAGSYMESQTESQIPWYNPHQQPLPRSNDTFQPLHQFLPTATTETDSEYHPHQSPPVPAGTTTTSGHHQLTRDEPGLNMLIAAAETVEHRDRQDGWAQSLRDQQAEWAREDREIQRQREQVLAGLRSERDAAVVTGGGSDAPGVRASNLADSDARSRRAAVEYAAMRQEWGRGPINVAEMVDRADVGFRVPGGVRGYARSVGEAVALAGPEVRTQTGSGAGRGNRMGMGVTREITTTDWPTTPHAISPTDTNSPTDHQSQKSPTPNPSTSNPRPAAPRNPKPQPRPKKGQAKVITKSKNRRGNNTASAMEIDGTVDDDGLLKAGEEKDENEVEEEGKANGGDGRAETETRGGRFGVWKSDGFVDPRAVMRPAPKEKIGRGK
ncbi:MAG: hypothetical protein M1817_003127 [Caeruleum heppii]|nr:MAG: hypothetical protein M1817_003127 [Caeruleum heppii]